MIFRKIAIILLSLLILLSGCSLNTTTGIENSEKEEVANIYTDENLGEQNETTDDLVTDRAAVDSDIGKNVEEDSSDSIIEEAIPESDKDEATEEKNEDGSENDSIIELIPMAQLPDLTLEPQEPFDMDIIAGYGTSVLTPVYHDTFRYQIREFTRNPARLVIDVGNTSDETLVITNDNLYFSIYDREGNEIAGSKVQGASVHIAPGEIKKVVVTAENPEAGVVHLEIGGVAYTLGYPIYRPWGDEEADVTDTTPYYKYGFTVDDENGVPYIIAQHPKQVIGNGKAKVVANGLIVVENERIGSLDKGEGWIPFKVGDARDGHGITLYTSHGVFAFIDLHTYPIF